MYIIFYFISLCWPKHVGGNYVDKTNFSISLSICGYLYCICSINARIMDDIKTKILIRVSYSLRKSSTYAVCV